MTRDRRRARTRVPGRAFLRPLVMLAAGIAAGAALWRSLMLEPLPPRGVAPETEQLSEHDLQALGDVLKRAR